MMYVETYGSPQFEFHLTDKNALSSSLGGRSDGYLAANKTKEGVVALPSGFQHKILTAGTGPLTSNLVRPESPADVRRASPTRRPTRSNS
jgi:hypothetical protein